MIYAVVWRIVNPYCILIANQLMLLADNKNKERIFYFYILRLLIMMTVDTDAINPANAM